MKLIDKDALVAEIERIRRIEVTNNDVAYNGALDEIRYFLDTLEVKEVDLDTDFGICWGNYIDCGGNINNYEVAKHFFELGMQQSKNYNNNEE